MVIDVIVAIFDKRICKLSEHCMYIRLYVKICTFLLSVSSNINLFAEVVVVVVEVWY